MQNADAFSRDGRGRRCKRERRVRFGVVRTSGNERERRRAGGYSHYEAEFNWAEV
jgi:hypothetical protein